jgi:tagatose 6-phosphate kinase
MIATVTLNAMLDKTVRLKSLRRGTIQRAAEMSMVAGGKGINVARQLTVLGAATVATGFVGGETGAMIKKSLDADRVPHDFVETETLTREGVTYREDNGMVTSVFEPPASVTPREAEQLVSKVTGMMAKCSWVVCSGSSPCADSDDVFCVLVSKARQMGRKTVLDSYGPALKRGWKEVPTLVKPNRQEYAATFGSNLRGIRSLRMALDEALNLGIEYVVMTDGPGPTFAASREGYWKIQSPRIRTVNPVGSGDVMIAGILYGLEQGWDFVRSLIFASAAGAANAQVWDVARCTLEDIANIEASINVEKLAWN